MNGKTARLIRKYSECLGYDSSHARKARKEWERSTSAERFAARKSMEKAIAIKQVS